VTSPLAGIKESRQLLQKLENSKDVTVVARVFSEIGADVIRLPFLCDSVSPVGPQNGELT
jgi:hypothetical protein